MLRAGGVGHKLRKHLIAAAKRAGETSSSPAGPPAEAAAVAAARQGTRWQHAAAEAPAWGLPGRLHAPVPPAAWTQTRTLSRAAQVAIAAGAVGVPLAAHHLLGGASPFRAHCYAPPQPAPPAPAPVINLEKQHPRRSSVLSDASAAVVEYAHTAVRGVYLLLLWLPAMATAPVALGLGYGRAPWIELLTWTLARAGPAFIKWGQWAATRPDLFPPDMCTAMARLQTSAPRHSFAYTKAAVEKAFVAPLAEVFDEFSTEPVASGSIAQVHRAVLSAKGAASTGYKAGTVVAVKVRHPGVSALMTRDFALMAGAANLSTRLPLLSKLALDESVRQFGFQLKSQLDLSVEARNLARFNYNFRRWRNVSFPAPIFPLVSPAVLVESFEQGRLISKYVDSQPTVQTQLLANTGLRCYLKMLIKDNFIHADLHPGNILVRALDPNSLRGRVYNFLHYTPQPHLVLLDVGMVAEMTPDDQRCLVAFFEGIASRDGRELAHSILRFSDNQTCPDPDRFVADMTRLFGGMSKEEISNQTSEVINQMMSLIREHTVNLKAVVSTVVVTTLVLEGWSTKLNPEINVVEELENTLPARWFANIRQRMNDLFLVQGAFKE